MSNEVTLDVTDAVATVTLNQPLFTPASILGLENACEAIRDGDSARCVLISGVSSGWDLDSFANEPEGTLSSDIFAPLATLMQPVVAAMEGEVSGGGLALALVADIRVCGDDATFHLSEVADGLIPLAGTIGRLIRAVGRGCALALILTGETIDAAEAKRIGLVSEVTPAGKTLERAGEIAAQIARRGPIAVQYAKEAVSRGTEIPLEQALRYETDLTILLQATKDRAEGVKAFVEKRQPDFKGE